MIWKLVTGLIMAITGFLVLALLFAEGERQQAERWDYPDHTDQ